MPPRASYLMLWTALACTPPGQGEKALAGFRASGAILHALGEHHATKGTYPDKLELLAPTSLSASQVTPPAGIARFDYESKGSSFTFAFRYNGPGVNTCTFTSTTRTWDCSGHY